MSFDLFRAEIDDEHPRLERLFEQAKQDFWNDSTAIDWSQPLTLTPDERVAMAKILSLIYYGERAALEVSAQLVPLVDDEQAKFVLACQVIEEAKHVSAFRRLLKKLDEIHPANPWVKRVLSDLVETRHASYKLVGMQLIVENIANQLFHIIHEHVKDPLIRKVLEYVGRDEKKHTGPGRALPAEDFAVGRIRRVAHAVGQADLLDLLRVAGYLGSSSRGGGARHRHSAGAAQGDRRARPSRRADGDPARHLQIEDARESGALGV